MFKHCAFFALRPDHDAGVLAEHMIRLAALVGDIPGLIDFVHGPNTDLEGLSRGYDYGLIVTFADRAAHRAYEANPAYGPAGEFLVAACLGGIDGILVADLTV